MLEAGHNSIALKQDKSGSPSRSGSAANGNGEIIGGGIKKSMSGILLNTKEGGEGEMANFFDEGEDLLRLTNGLEKV